MSMIFQSYALWPHMTVAENISYGLKLRKMHREDHGAQAQDHPRDWSSSSPWRNAILANCPADSSSAWRWRVR